MIYKGRIAIVGGTDDPLPVNCEVTDNRLVITTGDGSTIGDWGLREIGVESTRTGVILDVEGERLVVTIGDIDAFARALEEPEPPRAADRKPKTRQPRGSASRAEYATQSVQPWHGTKRCVTGARIPKANRVMGRSCPYCGNTLGAYIGSTATPGSTTEEKLTRLQGLRDDGLVTDQEYQERRSGILDEAVRAGPVPATVGSDGPKPVAHTRRNWNWGVIVGVSIAVLCVLAMIGAVLGRLSPVGPFHGTLVEFYAENPASLVIVMDVTNEGTDAGNWKCTLSANDPSLAYHGHGTFSSQTQLAGGATDRYRNHMIITGEGAAYVTEVELSGCERDY